MSYFLILQTAGIHDGSTSFNKNDYLRECLSLQYALIKNNQKCDIWGPRHKEKVLRNGKIYSLKNMPDFAQYDYVIILENYENLWFDLKNLKKYKNLLLIHWIIDLHYQSWHYYKKISEYSDIILHSTKLLMPSYEKLFPEKNHIWFPNAIDSRYFKKNNIKKIFDFIFVGNFVNSYRKNFIENLIKKKKLKYFMKTGNHMINLISSSKIHFNLSCSIDVNYRNFETISLGTCLCTNYLEELEKLGFKHGVNCIMYNTFDECSKYVDYYLENDRWKLLAEKGLLLSKKHTYINRVKTLLNVLKK